MATDRLALDLDELQYDTGDGPCLHAARTGELTEVPDTHTETRWTRFARAAIEHGSLSTLSTPLVVDPELQMNGALDIYARTPRALTAGSRAVAAQFSPYAAVATSTATGAHGTSPRTCRPHWSPERSSIRPRAS